MRSNQPTHYGALLVSVVVLSQCLGLSPLSGQDVTLPQDLLRFRNGDSLHGTFLGLDDGLLSWSHSEASEPISLRTDKIRRLSLHGGRARKTLRSPSFVQLADGDRIPGTLVSLGSDRLELDTEFAGRVSIPREFVSQISPRPHGGHVQYIGPFSDGEWTVVTPPEPAVVDNPDATDLENNEDPGEKEEAEAPWVFSGGAYYSNGQVPIAVNTNSGDQARIRFSLAWRNRLNAAIAFHATMKRPAGPGKEEQDENEAEAKRKLAANPGAKFKEGFAYTYGHSYVLTIYSNYAQIYRCDFTDEGEADIDRLSNSSANLRLDEAGEAEFEIRCDRIAGTIALFANGRFVSQWADRQGYVGSGSHLAFASQNSSARLRISDVLVTGWNGMMDSAQSMEAEDRDVVLLTNGTDRFSGELESLDAGHFLINGTYAEMKVPVEEIQEIRLAKSSRTEEDEEWASRQRIRVLLQPHGRLTVFPIKATADTLHAHHPALGQLNLNLDYAGLMEFSFGSSILDSWDDDY